uniref:Uncharacterized protein n=1 Tax=Arundo donax TaxID=35708 RepID=A0A0A9ANF9_ARUDO
MSLLMVNGLITHKTFKGPHILLKQILEIKIAKCFAPFALNWSKSESRCAENFSTISHY